MRLPVALFLLAVLVNLLPEMVAGAAGWSIKATEYVAWGMEAAALWWAAAVLFERLSWRDEPVRTWLPMMHITCAYGMFESLQRSACRLMFPMDRAPNVQAPYGLCEAAGVPTYDLTPLIIGIGVVVLSSTVSPSAALEGVRR